MVRVEEFVEEVDIAVARRDEAGWRLGLAGIVVAGGNGEPDCSIGIELGWGVEIGWRFGDEGEEESLVFVCPGRQVEQDGIRFGALVRKADGEGDVLVRVGAVGRVIGGAPEDVCGEGAKGGVALGLPMDVFFAVGGHAVNGGRGLLWGELLLGEGGECGKER